MKFAAKILTVLAVIILFACDVDAADSEKVFVEQAILTPPKLQRPPPLPIRTPRKDYAPRLPKRPAPRYLPSKPKVSYDNRGGRRKNFGPPQAPHR